MGLQAGRLLHSLPALGRATRRRLVPDNRGQRRAPLTVANIAAPRSVLDSRKVIVLTGPTAVGKTELSLLLAERLNGEIISADSVQVYRGLDVGSAKIPLEQRRGIPHHLIDILPPEAEFSAGHFHDYARQATEDILRRGRTPIVVGGTGFYLRWFVHGKPRTPTSTPELAAHAEAVLARAWAEAEATKGAPLSAEERWAAGTATLEAVGDPETAKKLRAAPNNRYRLQRQLEIVLATGRPLAELDLDDTAPLQYDFRCYFLTRGRLELYRRADARCEAMLADGLLAEAAWLLVRGVGPDQACAGRAIGYRQAMAALSCWRSEPSKLSEAGLVRPGTGLLALLGEVQAATRGYVHRQLHWFRADAMYRWLDASQPLDALATQLAAEAARSVHRGGEGGEGLLTREEERAMRGYMPRMTLFAQPEVQQRVLAAARDAIASLPAAPARPNRVATSHTV